MPYIRIKRVRFIAKRTLREFWQKHKDSEQTLKSWHQEVNQAKWRNLNELKAKYPKVSILQNNRVCFNINGNKYRLIVKINFHYEIVWIRFIGTHTEYDKINAHKI